MLRFVVVLALLSLLPGCARQKVWVPRVVPACASSTSDATLDRERTYLAALLAVQERGYAILRAEPPREIVADYTSDYRPERSHSRWLLYVQPDGSLEVSTPADHRRVHARAEAWYGRLAQGVQRLSCRDLNWLRWEAQNRGLLPVGAAVAPVAASAGGESAAPAGPAVAKADAARLARLEQQRSELRLARAITSSAVGAGLLVFSATLAAQGAVYALDGCEEDGTGPTLGRNCSSRETGRIFLWTSASTGLVAATVLSVALPRMIKRLRLSRELGREIKTLRRSTIQVGAGPLGYSLGLRTSF